MPKHYKIDQEGRFLIVSLLKPHLILSTSPTNGGFAHSATHIVNHQSCESSKHKVGEKIMAMGQEHYHQLVCEEMHLDVKTTVLMGTAANMHNLGQNVQRFNDIEVLAIVTAGVESNAGKAGDPGHWDEKEGNWYNVLTEGGTINTILLINKPFTEAAMVKASMMATEGKSAALNELAISSRYSRGLATGTGTDQLSIASIASSKGDETEMKTWSGHHTKIGELIGSSVKLATIEALMWQNGLDISRTRHISHALGRFGYDEKHIIQKLKSLLSSEDYELFLNNQKSVFYEAGVSASAFALAAVLDRKEYGGLPKIYCDVAILHQCSILASSLSKKRDLFNEFYQLLKEAKSEDPILKAIALGWQYKWK